MRDRGDRRPGSPLSVVFLFHRLVIAERRHGSELAQKACPPPSAPPPSLELELIHSFVWRERPAARPPASFVRPERPQTGKPTRTGRPAWQEAPYSFSIPFLLLPGRQPGRPEATRSRRTNLWASIAAGQLDDSSTMPANISTPPATGRDRSIPRHEMQVAISTGPWRPDHDHPAPDRAVSFGCNADRVAGKTGPRRRSP